MSIRTNSEEERFSKLTEEQQKLVLKFEEKYSKYPIPENDPGFELNFHAYIRFLVARKWDLEAATTLFDQWIQWRLDIKPHLYTPKDIPNELKCEKAYWHCFDKGKPNFLYLKFRRMSNYCSKDL